MAPDAALVPDQAEHRHGLPRSSGDLVMVEVATRLAPSHLWVTRIEHRQSRRGGEYYSVDGYPLQDGMQAALLVENP